MATAPPFEYAPAPEARETARRAAVLRRSSWTASSAPGAGETVATIDPSTGEPLAEVAEAGPADVDAAVAAARGRLRVGLARPARARAREVPLPHRARDPGARPRARRARVARQRQADPRVARRRRPAGGRALLLLRGLGRQARARGLRPGAAPARRRRADHPLELPAADGGLEARAGARDRQHRRAQARRDDAADRAHAGRDHRRVRPPARRRQRHRRAGRRSGRRSSSTRASTRSRSRARPRSAS